MKISYSPYLLKKINKLNSREQSNTQSGALIKVTEGESWGAADLCPKPEMGDDLLEDEIKNRGFLFARALELAQEDLEARLAKKSLLQNKFLKNNFLISDYRNVDLNQPFYAKQTVKIKADRDILSLSQLLNSLTADLRVRLDFNSCLNKNEFEDFLKLLSVEAKRKIEYIEDPSVFCIDWKRWNVVIPLAFDFQKTQYSQEFAKYRILKPSRQKVMKCDNFTLTSAMEHPVGLAHGLRLAQQMANNDSGFLTLDLFEAGDFNKYFEQKVNYLNFSQLALNDFGIGMSEELNKLTWREL
ncbi:MAG: hypothetical protein AABY53_07120 [Bdellovibrionota bacterium]